MGFVYDGRCCGCGYGMQNCHCAENNRKFEKYAAELFSSVDKTDKTKTSGMGAYVIESDGSIHKLRFVGDADWYDETLTTLTDVRCEAIDRVIQKARDILDSTDSDLYLYVYARIIDVARQVKEEIRNENSSDVRR